MTDQLQLLYEADFLVFFHQNSVVQLLAVAKCNLWTAAFSEKGKFLLAARRYRRGAHIEYIISLDVDDLSQGSQAYVGKLRYDFYDVICIMILGDVSCVFWLDIWLLPNWLFPS